MTIKKDNFRYGVIWLQLPESFSFLFSHAN